MLLHDAFFLLSHSSKSLFIQTYLHLKHIHPRALPLSKPCHSSRSLPSRTVLDCRIYSAIFSSLLLMCALRFSSYKWYGTEINRQYNGDKHSLCMALCTLPDDSRQREGFSPVLIASITTFLHLLNFSQCSHCKISFLYIQIFFTRSMVSISKPYSAPYYPWL